MIVLAILAAVGAGTIGGVFFAFSTFVMRALADLPAPQGIAAMQRINVVVLTPVFLGPFLGTAPLLGAAALLASRDGSPAWTWLAGACLLYAAGTVGVTIACNVPRNDRLARLAPESREALEYWPIYVREWLVWNHLRCAAAVAALAAVVVAVTR